MDRKNFFYLQVLTEAELDAAFADAERALWNFAIDHGLAVNETDPFERGGIISGWTASQSGDPSSDVQVIAGWGYTANGKRVKTTSSFTIDIAYEGLTGIGAGGTPAGNDKTPSAGYHRWMSLYIQDARALSDPRTDGYSLTVNHKEDESFRFFVDFGQEVLIASTPVKEAHQTGKILIADIKLENHLTNGVDISAVDLTRTEWWLNITGDGDAAKVVKTGDARDAIRTLVDLYSKHVSNTSGTADKHASEHVTHSTTATWAGGAAGTWDAAAEVKAALEAIVTDLADNTTVAGDERVGSDAVTGALATTGGGAPPTPTDLAQGTVAAQLAALLAAVNSRIFRGGDNGIGGDLSPDVNARTLGTATERWNVLAEDLTIYGVFTGDVVPDGDDTRSLGSTGARWTALFVNLISGDGNDLVIGDTLSAASVAVDLGKTATRFGTAYISELNSAGALLTDGTPQDIGTSSERWATLYATTVNAPAGVLSTSLTTPKIVGSGVGGSGDHLDVNSDGNDHTVRVIPASTGGKTSVLLAPAGVGSALANGAQSEIAMDDAGTHVGLRVSRSKSPSDDYWQTDLGRVDGGSPAVQIIEKHAVANSNNGMYLADPEARYFQKVRTQDILIPLTLGNVSVPENFATPWWNYDDSSGVDVLAAMLCQHAASSQPMWKMGGYSGIPTGLAVQFLIADLPAGCTIKKLFFDWQHDVDLPNPGPPVAREHYMEAAIAKLTWSSGTPAWARESLRSDDEYNCKFAGGLAGSSKDRRLETYICNDASSVLDWSRATDVLQVLVYAADGNLGWLHSIAVQVEFSGVSPYADTTIVAT